MGGPDFPGRFFLPPYWRSGLYCLYLSDKNRPEMKKNFFLLAAVLLCVCGTAFGWGKTGHDAIAYIAECNLTPRAKKNIGKYLDGRSIVYYASWMDAVRATEPYRATSKWHLDSMPTPNAVTCPVLPRATPCWASRMRWRNSAATAVRTIRRSVWRSAAWCTWWGTCTARRTSNIRGTAVSSSNSTAGNALSTASGTPRRWNSTTAGVTRTTAISSTAARSPSAAPCRRHAPRMGRRERRNCRVIYDWIKPGDTLDKARTSAYLMTVQPLAEAQVLKAGYRLARILNEIFG